MYANFENIKNFSAEIPTDDLDVAVEHDLVALVQRLAIVATEVARDGQLNVGRQQLRVAEHLVQELHVTRLWCVNVVVFRGRVRL